MDQPNLVAITNNQLVALVQQLQQMLAQQPGQQHPERPKDIRVNKPSDFDGNTNKARSFLLECELFLDCNEHQFQTDKQKI